MQDGYDMFYCEVMDIYAVNSLLPLTFLPSVKFTAAQLQNSLPCCSTAIIPVILLQLFSLAGTLLYFCGLEALLVDQFFIAAWHQSIMCSVYLCV